MEVELSFVAPPPGLNYIENVRHAMTLSLLAAMFASILVPMLIALFFFASQHACRRTYIFWLNVGSLVLGIVEGIYLVGIEVRSALHPPLPESLIILWYTLSFYTPVFVETILILRLRAVYRPETTAPKLRMFVVGFPVFMKILRLGLITALIAVWVTSARSHGIPLESGLLGWSQFPYPKIAWGMQLLDNTFCAVAFLKRLHHRAWLSDRHGTGPQRQRALDRLRTIFFIALTNYAIPAILGVIHLITAILDDMWDSSTWMYLCSYLMILNNYITIIGVVFATIWATSREWAGSHSLCVGDVSCAGVTSPTSSRTATSPSSHPGQPKSPRFWTSPYATPVSPNFPLDHYNGYHPNFKFSPDAASESETRDGQLKIHVTKETVSNNYQIEIGDVDGRSNISGLVDQKDGSV